MKNSYGGIEIGMLVGLYVNGIAGEVSGFVEDINEQYFTVQDIFSGEVSIVHYDDITVMAF